MTQCDRSNCKKIITRYTTAGKAGLCEVHYQIFLFNQKNKERRLLSICQYCSCSLAETRNSKYCSAACRQKGSRKIRSDSIASILNSSYWQHIEKTVKRNPFLLASITGPEDILDYYHLYICKARHQRSYAIPAYEGYQGKLKPVALLRLAICHQYPNSKGGCNTIENMIIAPEIINHRINDMLPYQHNGFPGIKSSGAYGPINGGLYTSLVKRYGLLIVQETLGRIKPAGRFYGTMTREIEFSGIDKEYPLFSLFHEELWRLGHQKLANCLRDSRQMFPFYSLYLELLAIVGFYAVLSGDADDITGLICRLFSRCFDGTIRDPHKRYTELIYLLLRKYLLRYFSVNIECKDSVVTFYNGFYSQEIISPGIAEDEVLCYRYFSGVRRYFSTFFYVTPWNGDPADMWRLLGADLTIE